MKANSQPLAVFLSGAGLALFGAGVGWGVMPQLVKMKVIQGKILTPGSEGRMLWESPPFPLSFKIFIFNVTNHLEVVKGAKPIVEEIGPYIFDEWKDKIDLDDDEEADTVSFDIRNTWIFNNSSFPLTGQEIVYLPHPALLGVLYTAAKEQPVFLGLLEIAFKDIFNRPQNIFLRTTVMDFLFNGNAINCTTKNNLLAMFVCSSIKKQGGFPEIQKNIFNFSIFGPRNGTRDAGRFQISRGRDNVQNVGKLVTFNGRSQLDIWKGMPCNSIAGTDSTVYPPFLDGHDLAIYATDICRSLDVKFIGTSSYKSVPSLMYSGSFGDMSIVHEEKCFCPKPNRCLKRGVMDITNCLGAPLIASLPHFYDCHSDYHEGITGLKPNGSIHGVVLQLEETTGVPLEIKKRLQFSLPIHPVQNVKMTMKLPKTTVPLFWVEEGLELNDEFLGELDSKLFSVLRGIDVGKWTTTAVGASASAVAAAWKLVSSFKSSPIATIN